MGTGQGEGTDAETRQAGQALAKGTGASPGPEVIKLFSCSTQLSTKF